MTRGILGWSTDRIDGNVDGKSTGQLTTTTYLHNFRAIDRFTEDYQQKSLGSPLLNPSPETWPRTTGFGLSNSTSCSLCGPIRQSHRSPRAAAAQGDHQQIVRA